MTRCWSCRETGSGTCSGVTPSDSGAAPSGCGGTVSGRRAKGLGYGARISGSRAKISHCRVSPVEFGETRLSFGASPPGYMPAVGRGLQVEEIYIFNI